MPFLSGYVYVQKCPRGIQKKLHPRKPRTIGHFESIPNMVFFLPSFFKWVLLIFHGFFLSLFVSLSCPYCPPQLLFIFSLLQSLVRQLKDAVLPSITLQLHLYLISFKGLLSFCWHLGISKVGSWWWRVSGRVGVRRNKQAAEPQLQSHLFAPMHCKKTCFPITKRKEEFAVTALTKIWLVKKKWWNQHGGSTGFQNGKQKEFWSNWALTCLQRLQEILIFGRMVLLSFAEK